MINPEDSTQIFKSLAPTTGGHRIPHAGIHRDGVLESVQSFETDGTRIVRIHAQRNPEKLARLASMLNSH